MRGDPVFTRGPWSQKEPDQRSETRGLKHKPCAPRAWEGSEPHTASWLPPNARVRWRQKTLSS